MNCFARALPVVTLALAASFGVKWAHGSERPNLVFILADK